MAGGAASRTDRPRVVVSRARYRSSRTDGRHIGTDGFLPSTFYEHLTTYDRVLDVLRAYYYLSTNGVPETDLYSVNH